MLAPVGHERMSGRALELARRRGEEPEVSEARESLEEERSKRDALSRDVEKKASALLEGASFGMARDPLEVSGEKSLRTENFLLAFLEAAARESVLGVP